MHQLLILLDDADYEKLKAAKSGRTWRQIILSAIDSPPKSPKKREASVKGHDAEWAKSRLENLELKERLRTQEDKQAKMQETFEKVLEELRAARKAADS